MPLPLDEHNHPEPMTVFKLGRDHGTCLSGCPVIRPDAHLDVSESSGKIRGRAEGHTKIMQANRFVLVNLGAVLRDDSSCPSCSMNCRRYDHSRVGEVQASMTRIEEGFHRLRYPNDRRRKPFSVLAPRLVPKGTHMRGAGRQPARKPLSRSRKAFAK